MNDHSPVRTSSNNNNASIIVSSTTALSSAVVALEESASAAAITYELDDGVVVGGGVEDSNNLPFDPAMTQKAIDGLQTKITRTKEHIKQEQTTRDANVNEYLKLSGNADRQQQLRIKQVFEKKNQKSAQSIAQHQKKLDEYLKRLKELEEHGIQCKQSPHVLQGLKNIRDGTKSIISKPKEFAHLLRHKFGSVDNLSSISKDSTPPQQNRDDDNNRSLRQVGSSSMPPTRSTERDRDGSSVFSEKHSSSYVFENRKCISDDGRRSEFSESVTSESNHPSSGPAAKTAVSNNANNMDAAEWTAVMQELTLHKEEVDQLREDMEEMRQHFKQAMDSINYQLREERDRNERLEEQMNDLTELHQHEIENIKSGVNDMEEKVQYQSDERLREITEHLQSLETKITSMEHQQAQQQYLNIEGLDSTNARAIMMKLLTAALTILHVILFFIGLFMNIAKPFVQSAARAFFTVIMILGMVLLYHHWEDVEMYYDTIKKWKHFEI